MNHTVPFSGNCSAVSSLGWDRGQGHSDRTVTSWHSSVSAFPTLTSFLNRADKNHNNEEKLLNSIWISVLDRPVLFHIA